LAIGIFQEAVMRSLAAIAIATLCALPHAAAAQTGTAPFCLQTPQGTRCSFGSMGECENQRGSTSGSQCITSSDARGTTGLGEKPRPAPGSPPQSPAVSAPYDQGSR
jgi:hypothetical protein